MLNFHSKLPKHLIVLSPSLSEGRETPIKVDIEYEWLPLRCTNCCSLGHTVAACPEKKEARPRPPVAVYVQKHQPGGENKPSGQKDEVLARCVQVEVTRSGCPNWQSDKAVHDVDNVLATQRTNISSSSEFSRPKSEQVTSKGKEIVVYNPFAILDSAGEEGAAGTVGQLVRDRRLQFLGVLETRVRRDKVQGFAPICCRIGVGLMIIRVRGGVYGLLGMRLRLLWAELLSISADVTDLPWCVLGDFNVVADASESFGNSVEATQSMAEFREFIMEAGLAHLPFTGCPFTWHNCSSGSRSLWRRLDRVLVNDNWLIRWPQASYLSALPQTSDHSPLILLGDQRRMAGGTFRFDNFLTSQPGFLQSVRHVWCHRIHGTKMYEVTRKLKALKPLFRAQRKNKGDLANNVCLAKGFLEKAQSLFDMFKEDALLLLVQWCRQVYCRAVAIEDSVLRQRAKLRWLKYGDKCSKAFFRKINRTRAKMRVFQITSAAGVSLTEEDQIVAEFIAYYEALLGGNRLQRSLQLDFLQPYLKHTLSMEEAAELTLPITPTEIKDAFLTFLRTVLRALTVSEFFASGRMLKQINATVLVLIPKVQMPTRIPEFRPIACCNVLYKAISKILVKRMQRVLHKLIDYSQNAFIPGRCIADNIMLAQELLSGYNQARLPKRCTIKIDIQKAYDSVQWDFLFETLKLFQFPLQFITWIEQCVTTAMFSISLNGCLHFFAGARGLRQGDPVSPYLFVIVMEILHVLLKLRIQSEEEFRYHWKCSELGIINLCFADDVLIFCAGDLTSVRLISEVLEEFEGLSGLRVNPSKSTIILSKSVQQDRQILLNQVGFQEGKLPIKYLGVPLTASRLTVADCRPILEKVSARLAGWGHLNLSLAGRAQLLKSVLASLHVYWSSVFFLPKSIIKVIEQRMRAFLWKGSTGSGLAKVSWDHVCKSKEEGGLGLRRVLYMNQALMLKNVWRLLQEDPNSIWVAWVLRYRLRRHSIWTVNTTTASWCWKQLVKASFLIKDGIEYRVGYGNRFRIWTDLWHPSSPLIHTFPRGPILSGLPKDARLLMVIRQGQWCWPAETETEIQQIMAALPALHPQQSDQILWKTSWLNMGWQTDIIWASRRWRGRHLLNEASRALLASIVYHVWSERNSRIFSDTASSAETVACRALEEVRLRIIGEDLKPSLQQLVLFRIWHIPWC
ncbi:UNVERIFIED_CONTAM: Retrovirus-related Pol polyprotein from type-2 retrotransposable element R2DM [Sesamum radiatum]|uniref:Retrovirus-related Pol polyprotein from type-2 retrotransposable element R2DM n=1 Tax=Sesamum radiatum TaxID=300843 RepID=A0AAW2IKK9_SESRA